MDKNTKKWISIPEYDGDDETGKPVFCERQYCPSCHYSTWLIPKKCPECGEVLAYV